MRFKIIGGSFGESGKVVVNSELHINGAIKHVYKINDIQKISSKEGKWLRKTSILSVLVGIMITLFLTLFLSVFGLITGIIITALGSRYSSKTDPTADILFTDGKDLFIQGSKRNINKLINTYYS